MTIFLVLWFRLSQILNLSSEKAINVGKRWFWYLVGHFEFWQPSWIFFILPYLSHFESYWNQNTDYIHSIHTDVPEPYISNIHLTYIICSPPFISIFLVTLSEPLGEFRCRSLLCTRACCSLRICLDPKKKTPCNKKTVDPLNRVGFRKVYTQESTIFLFHSCTDRKMLFALAGLKIYKICACWNINCFWPN